MITYDHNNKKVDFSIDSLDDIIKAKSKGMAIIESCITNKQLDSAKRYVGYYKNATKDLVGTSELELEILSKRKKIGEDVFGKKHWNKLIKSLRAQK